MIVGKLDRLATILVRRLDHGLAGQRQERFDEGDSVWCGKADVAGREFVSAGRELSERTTILTMRWRGDVTPADRVRVDAEDFEIVSTAELGRREGLQLTCRLVGK